MTTTYVDPTSAELETTTRADPGMPEASGPWNEPGYLQWLSNNRLQVCFDRNGCWDAERYFPTKPSEGHLWDVRFDDEWIERHITLCLDDRRDEPMARQMSDGLRRMAKRLRRLADEIDERDTSVRDAYARASEAHANTDGKRGVA